MNDNLIVVGRVGDDGKVIVSHEKFRYRIDSKTTISEYTVQKIDNQWHLVATGTNGGTNCYMTCWPAQFTPEGNVAVDPIIAGKGCIGSQCSQCRFANGGCECINLAGYCNHIITLPFSLDD
jgi:hypothetical protein